MTNTEKSWVSKTNEAPFTKAQALTLLSVATNYQPATPASVPLLDIPVSAIKHILGADRATDCLNYHSEIAGELGLTGYTYPIHGQDILRIALNPGNSNNLEKVAGASYQEVQAMSKNDILLAVAAANLADKSKSGAVVAA